MPACKGGQRFFIIFASSITTSPTMKKFILLTQILLLSLLMACESDTPTLPSESKALAGNISTRSNTTETLGEGSRILLNARGGLTIENELFTYNNGAWSNENGHKWGSAEETTHITALYPHDATSPYNGDALKDILISQATLPPGETNVSLIFKHLFASFTLNVDETLVDMISTIQLTTPQKIASISPTTGEITLTESTNTTTLTGNGSGSYTFIIPPMQASIELGITLTNGKSQTYTLQRHCFESGLVYECRLRDWNMVPGIRDVNDFIAFSQLINGKSYGTYELSDFGERQSDGRMLYRLLADIDFRNQNLADLLPICYDQNKSFNDIFDGSGYQITYLTINPSNSVTGVFGRIGSKGIVKNLHLSHCSTPIVSSSSSAGVGLIAASLSGIISNCSVTNGNITATDETYRTGALVGNAYTGSQIINSYVQNTTISSKGYLGCIVGAIDNGKIINCFSVLNELIGNSKNECGGFCGKAIQSNITNCYNYNLTFKNTTINGMVIGEGENSTLTFHYSDSRSPLLIYQDNNCKKENYAFFSINAENISTILCNRLNQWIKANQSSYEYPFTEWKPDDSGNLPAIFQ